MIKFRRYYLPMFILFGAVVLIASIPSWSDFSMAGFFLACGTVLLAAAIMGRVLDFAENVWTPKRRKKYFNQSPLKDLSTLGLVNVDDKYFSGEYKGFCFFLIYDHSFQRMLVYEVLHQADFEDSTDEYNRMKDVLKNNKLELTPVQPGKIGKVREIKFKMPSLECIKDDLDSIVAFMIEKGIDALIPSKNSIN
ncbi:MAG: hypothetical protein GQ574_08000 [Crocinitomix sp.]|nr:hypothetical protein [Crocinitomix sp.]